MDGLTVGRMVHFVAENGEHLAAIVSWVWVGGTVNLIVYNPYNGNHDEDKAVWDERSVLYSEEKDIGTWHWIEPA